MSAKRNPLHQGNPFNPSDQILILECGIMSLTVKLVLSQVQNYLQSTTTSESEGKANNLQLSAAFGTLILY